MNKIVFQLIALSVLFLAVPAWASENAALIPEPGLLLLLGSGLLGISIYRRRKTK